MLGVQDVDKAHTQKKVISIYEYLCDNVCMAQCFTESCGIDTLSALMQGKYKQAEPLYERSQAIREKALGPDHPHVAAVLSNRASLLRKQVRGTRASGEPFHVAPFGLQMTCGMFSFPMACFGLAHDCAEQERGTFVESSGECSQKTSGNVVMASFERSMCCRLFQRC